jgi:hypothetical protein
LYFLQEPQVKSFETEILFVNPMRYFLLNERGNFSDAKNVIDAINYTDTEFKNKISENEKLNRKIIFDGTTKDLIVNYAQLVNKYVDFTERGATLKDTAYLDFSGVAFRSNTMKQYPKIEKISNISLYSFKSYSATRDTAKEYEAEQSYMYDLGGAIIVRHNFDGYGEANEDLPQEINYALSTDDGSWTIDVVPIKWNSQENTLSTDIIGEVYSENNPLNVYNDKDIESSRRFTRLSQYFNSNAMVLTFDCLPNLSVETGDLVNVETNLYNEYTGKNLIASGWVVGMELKYNGALWQKITVHTLQEAL